MLEKPGNDARGSATILRRPAVIAIPVVLLAIAASLLIWQQSGAEDPEQTAINNLQQTPPPQSENSLVAMVNDHPIRQESIDIQLALQPVNDLGEMSAGEILAFIIDDYILVDAAVAAGVVVTEEEVTQTIELGLVEPLQTGALPDDLDEIFRTMLANAGVSVDEATEHPELRESYRRFLLRNRFVAESGLAREELLQDLRADASVEIVDAQLKVEADWPRTPDGE